MLGQAIANAGRGRGMSVVGIARSNADIDLDITDDAGLSRVFSVEQPDVVINTAAVVSLDDCERNLDRAWQVNTRSVQILGELAAASGAKLVQISTDHYFTGDADLAHDEHAEVKILNEYARTKYAAELIAAQWPDSLTLRTNLVGFRGWKGRPTFVEWVLDTLHSGGPVTMFEDVYTSSIDVVSFADAMFDLIERGGVGTVNLASREVFTKRAFIEGLAGRFGLSLANASGGSVSALATPRAESLGLSTVRAEELLGRPLPTFSDVIENLIAQAAGREIEYAV